MSFARPHSCSNLLQLVTDEDLQISRMNVQMNNRGGQLSQNVFKLF
jgi:hypothetical protein